MTIKEEVDAFLKQAIANKERPDWNKFMEEQMVKQGDKKAIEVASYEHDGKIYTVSLCTATGKYTCNCRSYIFGNYNKKEPADFSQERTCKHIEDTVANKDKKLEVVLGLSGKYTVTVRRGQWSVNAKEKA